MSASADEDVDVHLSRYGTEGFGVAEGYDLMPVQDANPQWAML